jgi:DNA-binding transcriptional MerR regulator
MPTDDTYTIADLARLTGLNVRTIRYYIAQGLIPASGESGPGAHYGQGHLDRLRLTKRLQGQHLPLAEIRQRMAALTDDEVAGLVATAQAQAEPETSALEYVRSLLGAAPTTALAEGSPFFAPPAGSVPVAPLPLVAGLAEPGVRRPQVAAMLARRAQGQVLPPEDEQVRGAPLLEGPRMPGMPAMRDRPATGRDGPMASEASRATELSPPGRSQWERHSLAPNIELHVRRPLGRLEQRRVERLITIARQVLKEDGV